MWHACSQVYPWALVFIRLRLNISAAWQGDPFMCPLHGPIHQSLTRNMLLPGARSDFSPYHGIKATLLLLMEVGGGRHSGYSSSISQTIYPISSYCRHSSAGRHVVVIWRKRRALLDDLTDLKLAWERDVELSNRPGYDRCHLKRAYKSPSILCSASYFKVRQSSKTEFHDALRSNVTVAWTIKAALIDK